MRDKDKAHGSIPGGLEAAYSGGEDYKGHKSGKGGRMARGKRVGKHRGRKRGRKK